jgi:hypothetical protein
LIDIQAVCLATTCATGTEVIRNNGELIFSSRHKKEGGLFLCKLTSGGLCNRGGRSNDEDIHIYIL